MADDPRSAAPDTPPARLVLGSTSRYRRALLQRLRLPFDVDAPDVDETAEPGETPAALARRLALAKAQAVARRWPQAIVIGADQVADLDGDAIGKPGDHARAVAQLRAMAGRVVHFHSAVAVVRPATGFVDLQVALVQVRLRALDDAAIERYLRLDEPYDCAGSARCEALGITLAEAIDSDDPTALEGLPLIRTSAMLRSAGLDPLRWAR